MRIASILILSAALTQPVLAQSGGKISPVLQQQLSHSKAKRMAGNTLIPAFIQIDDEAAIDTLQKWGVDINYRANQILSARVPLAVLSRLADVPGIRYVDGGVEARPMLDKARAASGVDRIHQAEGLTQAYTGKGVLVGVVDAGFDYRQPAYRASDAHTSRILRAWEQNYEKGTAPDGFTYGGEIVGGEKLIEAQGDVTTSSHGGHVLGIAAGRDCGNGWGGVAPEADIALVSMGALQAGNVNIADGVQYLFNVAKANGQPCVVNLSLGTQIGPHDGTSLFDQLTDAMQGEGRIIVGSAGNFGSDPIHVSTADGQPISTRIEFKSTSQREGKVDVWGTKGQAFKVQVQLVKSSTGAVAGGTELLDASAPEGATATTQLTSNAKGTVTVTTEVNPNNGRPHALIDLNLSSLRFGYVLALHIEPASADSRVDAWADDVYLQFSKDKSEYFVPGNTDRTLAEIGGTGKRIITVGAYTTRAEYKAAGSTQTSKLDETVGAISSFSAAGPALDGRMKPDVCAPGCFIISTLNGNSSSLSSEVIADGITFEGHSHYWGYMQGTSMASPFVAGTVALWLEANATLTPEQIRDVLDHSCFMDEGTNSADVDHWGRGKLDAWAGLKYVISTVGIHNAKTDASSNFSVRRSDGSLEVLFAHSGAHAPLQLFSASGMLLRTVPVSTSLGSVSLPVSGLPSGTYVLRVDGKSVKVAW